MSCMSVHIAGFAFELNSLINTKLVAINSIIPYNDLQIKEYTMNNREAREAYIQAQEQMVDELSKLYTVLVNEDCPENCDWAHVGDIQRVLADLQDISRYVLATS